MVIVTFSEATSSDISIFNVTAQKLLKRACGLSKNNDYITYICSITPNVISKKRKDKVWNWSDQYNKIYCLEIFFNFEFLSL